MHEASKQQSEIESITEPALYPEVLEAIRPRGSLFQFFASPACEMIQDIAKDALGSKVRLKNRLSCLSSRRKAFGVSESDSSLRNFPSPSIIGRLISKMAREH